MSVHVHHVPAGDRGAAEPGTAAPAGETTVSSAHPVQPQPRAQEGGEGPRRRVPGTTLPCWAPLPCSRAGRGSSAGGHRTGHRSPGSHRLLKLPRQHWLQTHPRPSGTLCLARVSSCPMEHSPGVAAVAPEGGKALLLELGNHKRSESCMQRIVKQMQKPVSDFSACLFQFYIYFRQVLITWISFMLDT